MMDFNLDYSVENPDLTEFGAQLWERIIQITESNQGFTTLEAYPFIAGFGRAASDAFSRIKRLEAEQRR